MLLTNCLLAVDSVMGDDYVSDKHNWIVDTCHIKMCFLTDTGQCDSRILCKCVSGAATLMLLIS